MKSQLIFFFLLFAAVHLTSGQSTNQLNLKLANSEDNETLNTIYKKGDYGYACFRIPVVVVTNKGSILAFAEGRKKSCSDTGNIDIVMRKSMDNGLTWSDLKIIWDDGENVSGNPAPVIDEITGDIHLLTTWNNGKDHESRIIEGTSIKSREIFHQVSVDDGETWTSPQNITKFVKLPNWTWYATGPVHGIQLKKGQHKGRLIIPCDHIEADSKKYYSHVIFSDDHGKTWQLGGRTPDDQVNECTIAELQNGDLMLNMRNYKRNELQARQVAISRDGGITWKNQHIDTGLPEPRCQGAILSVQRNGENILLFTNPANSKKRINITLSISRSEGMKWEEKIVVFPGHAAYSDLTELKNKKIFVLYEAGYESPYDGIHYKIIDID